MNPSVVIIVVVLVFIAVVLYRPQRSGFVFDNADYEYSNPSVIKEWYYANCVAKECGGNTFDYPCLEKCHLKTFRTGMLEKDIVDMVCEPYSSNEHAYYQCLDNVYADYKYP